MKKILYTSKRDVFSAWLNEYFTRTSSKYIWAQICYDWNTGELLHVVFEKNTENECYIEWPVYIPDIPTTNIDFTGSHPTLENGEPWDYRSWHIHALSCVLLNEPTGVPGSFWDWRLNTRPQGNATCDLDFLCKTKEGEYIGIEATEIYYVETSSNFNRDVYEHFQRLLKLRRGSNPGFNLRQLQAQKNFVQIFGGRMFMLFHQILKDNEPYRLREDKCLLLEINDLNYQRIESIVSQSSYAVYEPPTSYSADDTHEEPMQGIKRNIRFVSLRDILDRFVD